MPTGRHQASALCVSWTPDGILVVGGRDASRKGLRTTELLFYQLGLSGEDMWLWRTLPLMLEPRSARPGVLLVAELEYKQRVLVAGGTRGCRTTEFIQFHCQDNTDHGQWTKLVELSKPLYMTHLICFQGRVLVFGKAFF